MESFFATHFGIGKEVFDWVVLPLVVFLARISDVTLSTVRIMFVMSGRRNLAPLLGFFEALIWLMAIGQIIRNISNVASYIAYAGGFATGTYIGMYIEGKLALGKVIVRVITRSTANDMLDFLRSTKFGFTFLDASGRSGDVNLIFSVVERKDLAEFIGIIKRFNPNAFYTVEGVRYASEGGLASVEEEKIFTASRLPLFKRFLK